MPCPSAVVPSIFISWTSKLPLNVLGIYIILLTFSSADKNLKSKNSSKNLMKRITPQHNKDITHNKFINRIHLALLKKVYIILLIFSLPAIE